MRYTIKHTIETDVDTFWNVLFFDAEFNRSMFVDHLGFTTYRVLEDRTDPDGTHHRRIECAPKIDLPVAARKIFGDTFGYTEVGRFDPRARRYHVEALPNVGGDKVKTSTEIWVEPIGDKRCERIVHVDNSVKYFGIGTFLEGFVEQATRDSYAKAAEFTNRWIREKGL